MLEPAQQAKPVVAEDALEPRFCPTGYVHFGGQVEDLIEPLDTFQFDYRRRRESGQHLGGTLVSG